MQEAGKEGHARSAAGSTQRFYQSSSLPQGNKLPGAGLCVANSRDVSRRAQLSEDKLTLSIVPRLDSLICHSPLHLPVLKTQSQMLKQHPTGVLYQSKQPGKIYEKGGTHLFPTPWNRKVKRIFDWVPEGARGSQVWDSFYPSKRSKPSSGSLH